MTRAPGVLPSCSAASEQGRRNKENDRQDEEPEETVNDRAGHAGHYRQNDEQNNENHERMTSQGQCGRPGWFHRSPRPQLDITAKTCETSRAKNLVCCRGCRSKQYGRLSEPGLTRYYGLSYRS